MSDAGSPACAACKFQRKKCTPDCILRPHFPSSRDRDFHNAHKLFGVKNLSKTLSLCSTDEQRKAAANSLIFEANARAADPVGGCYAIIMNLDARIRSLEQEIQFLKSQIAFRKTFMNPPPPLPNVYSYPPLPQPTSSIDIEREESSSADVVDSLFLPDNYNTRRND